MDVVNLIDLSALTSKEQAIIQEVLKRDANLRKCEEQRIRRMRMKTLDNRSMKLQTGEWFEDLKAKRFAEYPSATDLLQDIFHQDAKSGFVQPRKTSCLTKIKSLKFLQMFAGSTITADLARRCSVKEKNFAIKEECSPSPGADEQLSVTQILKDLELILDLEITSSSSNAEIADINGFGPENVMVDKKLPSDYSSHQVWHYPAPTNIDASKNKNTSSVSDASGSASQPGLLSLETFLTNLSPIKNAKMGSVKGLPANEYDYSKEVGIEEVQLCHKQIYQHIGNTSVLVSSGLLGEPLCSSPCLEAQFQFSGDNIDHAAKYIDISHSKKYNLGAKELAELSCETTENTIELLTMIAGNSSCVMEDHVPLTDAILEDK